MSIGVVIPTYQRPDWLRRAFDSLCAQTQKPDFVVIVCRDTDAPTLARAEAIKAEGPLHVVIRQVSEPGHIPPIASGTKALLQRDVDFIAWLDDDAEAPPSWCERGVAVLQEHPAVGAVGGRVRNRHLSGEIRDEGSAEIFAHVDRLGRPIGNMYRDGGRGLSDADFFMAGNIWFRQQALSAVRFDMALNKDVAFHYELDIGFQLHEAGWRILYDADNPIEHYSAPRENDGMRNNKSTGIRSAVRNLTRIRLRHMNGKDRLVALSYGALVGGRREPGYLSALPLALQERSLAPLVRAKAAWQGRIEAYLAYALEERK